MAIMDIADIRPLLSAVHDLLADHGIFVFATQHPCFVTRDDKYITAHSYEGEAIMRQPFKQLYFHRSLQDFFNVCFDTGFVIDVLAEIAWKNSEIPEVIIVRARKK
ncbi:MAG: hypothetical protein PUE57_01125 [Lactimicrobium massiliense]|nr:hypothetical protein [Lactimicrobium massiliense]MDD6674245.1 hypothetical protein [Lactimicrobium massiliense]